MSFLIPKDDSRLVHFEEEEKEGNNFQVTEDDELELKKNDKKSLKSVKSGSSSVINFYPRWCHCFSCLLHSKDQRRGEKVSCGTRLRDAFSCPPAGVLGRFILFFVMCGTFWFVIWSLHPSLAEDTISAFICLEILGLSVGILFKLCGLPTLLAPLIIGIVLKNLPFMNFFWGLHERRWIEAIREMALTIILTRAGVELSPKQLKKLKLVVPLCAFGPCVIEAMTCAALFYCLFYTEGVPVAMCFVAGFALSAVSPAVVVPGMLTLKRKKFGTQAIHTLLIASSSIDDVLAISAFSISLTLVDQSSIEKGSEWKSYSGFLGIIVGVIHGLVFGVVLHFIPSRDVGRPLPHLRLVVLLLLNFTSMFIYKIESLDWLSGAGSLAVLCTSFFASFGWRSVPHWKQNMKTVETSLAHIWTLCVPLIFGTIGNEMNFRTIGKRWDYVGKVLLAIICSLTIRCLFMFLVSGCARLTVKERLFCALAWIPKATVQCALAPLVISRVERSTQKQVLKKHAQNVVTMAVLSVLITAPLGAVLINLTGPKLLRKTENLPDEFPNGGEGELDAIPSSIRDDSNGDKLQTLFVLDTPSSIKQRLSSSSGSAPDTTTTTNLKSTPIKIYEGQNAISANEVGEVRNNKENITEDSSLNSGL